MYEFNASFFPDKLYIIYYKLTTNWKSPNEYIHKIILKYFPFHLDNIRWKYSGMVIARYFSTNDCFWIFKRQKLCNNEQNEFIFIPSAKFVSDDVDAKLKMYTLYYSHTYKHTYISYILKESTHIHPKHVAIHGLSPRIDAWREIRAKNTP